MNDDSFTQTLAGFRSRIDALDNQLIALIKERCQIVHEVGELKGKHLEARCFIRPGREASMVARIAGEFEGHPFSSAAAAHIWRLIISASTSIEQPLRITSVFSPDQQEAYWLAREYFGAFANVSKETAPARVLGQVIDGNALVGVLPALDAGQDDPWWRLLIGEMERGRPNIFACLPYAFNEGPLHPAGSEPRPQAIAVGYVDCEPTGDDVTYIVIEGRHELSQNRIHTHFAEASRPARWLQVYHDTARDSRLHLIELDGFVTKDDALLTSLEAQCREHLHGIHHLGAHAKPILLAN